MQEPYGFLMTGQESESNHCVGRSCSPEVKARSKRVRTRRTIFASVCFWQETCRKGVRETREYCDWCFLPYFLQCDRRWTVRPRFARSLLLIKFASSFVYECLRSSPFTLHLGLRAFGAFRDFWILPRCLRGLAKPRLFG